jgi:hypothetical protein
MNKQNETQKVPKNMQHQGNLTHHCPCERGQNEQPHAHAACACTGSFVWIGNNVISSCGAFV